MVELNVGFGVTFDRFSRSLPPVHIRFASKGDLSLLTKKSVEATV
jgi:hypothetical protein